MSNTTLFYLTTLGLVLMGLLIVFNFTSQLKGSATSKEHLDPNHIRGMAISHNQLLYTLNFKQQNIVIDVLNQSKPLDAIPAGMRKNSNIDKLVIYQFEGKPALEIQPFFYVDNNLFYSLPEWQQNGYLIEQSNGRLKQLFTESYDP